MINFIKDFRELVGCKILDVDFNLNTGECDSAFIEVVNENNAKKLLIFKVGVNYYGDDNSVDLNVCNLEESIEGLAQREFRLHLSDWKDDKAEDAESYINYKRKRHVHPMTNESEYEWVRNESAKLFYAMKDQQKQERYQQYLELKAEFEGENKNEI